MHRKPHSITSPEPSPRRDSSLCGGILDSPPVDTHYAAAVRRGDVAAYEVVFRGYYATLCAFALRLVGSWDDAEEVVQTVFSTLWQRHEQLRVTNTLKSYLYAAVRNEALNSLKHRRVVDRAHAALAAGEIPAAHAAVPLPPDLTLERDEVTARIRAAVADLPTRARDVLLLRWEHGMSYDDVGATLGIRPQSARMQHSRALAMLRKRLADLMPPASAVRPGGAVDV